MNINEAFDELQATADADPEQVREARRRRDLFRGAFTGEDDVLEFLASGSLARSTQRESINDVDVIVVFDQAEHPTWGTSGDSAADALSHTGARVNELLGATSGSVAQEVRLARPGNHAVKCFLDDPDAESPFTVDAMPALRQANGTLLVPEKASQRWILTDPEHLIARVAARQGDWSSFRPLVRALKLWKDVQDTSLKSLTVEVLALGHLPQESSRARALQRFFTAAELAIELPIEDPAGLCGPTQSEIDLERAKPAISVAAKTSWEAVVAQDEGDTDRAACLWRTIFGEAFPEPPDGCPAQPSKNGGLAGVAVGIGAVRPRPVKDAPQG
ncbi:MAG: hypothetical protein ACLQMH_07505 [Solirubrobacteraceae bacterium]